MQTQLDYEADVLLAVFPSATAAADAERALGAASIPSTAAPLAPGRYQVADRRFHHRFRESIGAAIIGAVVGALIGVGLAAWLFGGDVAVIVGLAVAGAFCGSVVGPLYGIARTSRYDDDVAPSTLVEPGSTAVVLRAEPPVGSIATARDLLVDAGAIALLDVAAYEARVRGSLEPTVVESTSAGDSAAPAAVPRYGRTETREPDEHGHRPAA
jgi:hypothetical protein